MSKIRDVERKVWRVEGFQICFLYLDGVDVRGDKEGLPQYTYERAASNDMTVDGWKRTRFLREYPGFDVAVIDRRGNRVRGNTKLATVRATYEEG